MNSNESMAVFFSDENIALTLPSSAYIIAKGNIKSTFKAEKKAIILVSNSAGWKAKADDGQAKYIVKSVLCGYSEYTLSYTVDNYFRV